MKPSLLTLCLLLSFPTVGAVLFTPALASLLDEFSISTTLAQSSVSVYLAGYALGQLPYGWLATRIGRKRTIYVGLILFACGALLCGMSSSFKLLLIGRGVMALGAAVGLMMTFAIVSAIYTVKEARRILAFVTMAAVFAPGVANLIGGMLTSFAGWKSCFYFLTAYAGIVGLLVMRLPECGMQVKSGSYLAILKQGRFLLLTLMAALTTTVIYIFAATAPLITVSVLELSPYLYGLVSIVPFIGSVSGCLLSAKLSNQMAAPRVMAIGIFVCLTASISKWCLIHFVGLKVWSLFLPMPFIYLGLPMVYSNSIALALAPMENKSIASSLFCAFNIGLSFLGVSMMSWFDLESLSHTALAFVIISALMFIAFWYGQFAKEMTPAPAPSES